jgi:hypothetical protein
MQKFLTLLLLLVFASCAVDEAPPPDASAAIEQKIGTVTPVAPVIIRSSATEPVFGVPPGSGGAFDPLLCTEYPIGCDPETGACSYFPSGCGQGGGGPGGGEGGCSIGDGIGTQSGCSGGGGGGCTAWVEDVHNWYCETVWNAGVSPPTYYNTGWLIRYHVWSRTCNGVSESSWVPETYWNPSSCPYGIHDSSQPW